MSGDLPTYVQGFRDNLSSVPQQKLSRFKKAVMFDPKYAEPGTSFNCDDVQTLEEEEPRGRGAPIEYSEVDVERRGGFFRPKSGKFFVDKFDKLRAATDPTSEKMSGLLATRERNWDDFIYQTMLGAAWYADNSGNLVGSVNFTTGQTIAVDFRDVLHDSEAKIVAASGDLGLTVGKIIKASTELDASELDGKRYHTIDKYGMNQLLASAAATSSDYYKQVVALQNGEISSFMGFEFIKYQRHNVSSGITDYVAWIDQAVAVKGRGIVDATITQRTDLELQPWQAYYAEERAGVRRYDTGVMKVRAKQIRALA